MFDRVIDIEPSARLVACKGGQRIAGTVLHGHRDGDKTKQKLLPVKAVALVVMVASSSSKVARSLRV